MLANRKLGLGGEAVSLAVKYKDSAAFKAAGYQDLKVNASYVGGLVRQVGRLSFTRVFDAGQEGVFASQLIQILLTLLSICIPT